MSAKPERGRAERQGFVCLWLQRQPGRDDGGRKEPIATATVSRRWAQHRLGGKEAIISCGTEQDRMGWREEV